MDKETHKPQILGINRIICKHDDCRGRWQSTAEQVTALIMAGASVVAYILAEGLTDAANTSGTLEEQQEGE